MTLVRGDTNLPIILFQIQSDLITNNIYNSTQVYITTRPENLVVPPNVPNYVVICPGPQDQINPECRTFQGEIQIRIFYKMYVDIAQKDEIQLVKQRGIVSQVNAIINLLNLRDLVNQARAILAEPMRYVRQEKFTREDDWTQIYLYFNIKYGEDPTIVSPTAEGYSEYTYEYNIDYA